MSPETNRILERDELALRLAEYRKGGARIVLANGCLMSCMSDIFAISGAKHWGMCCC